MGRVCVNDVGFGYSPFPHELSRDPRISLQAKGLFAVYGSFVSVNDPTAYPSEEYICRLCGGLNAKTFRKYKKELLDSGWIAQEQSQHDNGQYSTLHVTRFYHPGMNPNFAIKSTDDQKTDGGKTDGRKLALHKQKPALSNNQKDTQQKVCVLTGDEKACIDWVIEEARKKGTLKNEAGLRSVLTQKAQNKALCLTEYLAHVQAQEQSKKCSDALIRRVDDWKREAEAQPINWEDLKAQHPRLFKKGSPGRAPDHSGGPLPGRTGASGPTSIGKLLKGPAINLHIGGVGKTV